MITDEQILNARILIIDDDEISIRILTEVLYKAGFQYITSTKDPRQAIPLYQQIQPDVIVLDLYMPYLDGLEVLGQLKEMENDEYIPVIVLSTEDNPDVQNLILRSGAKDFLHKPYDRLEVVVRIRNLIEVRLLYNQVKEQNKLLEERVKQRTQELYENQLDVMRRLAQAIEYRDAKMGMHLARMSQYAACLAAKVGLSQEECRLILAASTLHDIGKIGIPDSVLLKVGKLTPQEWEVMKTHTTMGSTLLAGSNFKFIKMAQEIALYHHEKWDGSGYPQGLKGEAIPLVGRICCLCDVFDALTSRRPYKMAWSIEKAIEEIKHRTGSWFEPHLVNCFLEILPQIRQIKEQYPEDEVDETL